MSHQSNSWSGESETRRGSVGRQTSLFFDAIKDGCCTIFLAGNNKLKIKIFIFKETFSNFIFDKKKKMNLSFETNFRGKHLPPAALSYPVTCLRIISSLLNTEVQSGDICCYLFPLSVISRLQNDPLAVTVGETDRQTDSSNGSSLLSDLKRFVLK